MLTKQLFKVVLTLINITDTILSLDWGRYCKLLFSDELSFTCRQCECSVLVITPFFSLKFSDSVVCFLSRDFHPHGCAGRPRYWPFDYFLHTGVLSQERRHGRPVHMQHPAHCGLKAGVPSSDIQHHL